MEPDPNRKFYRWQFQSKKVPLMSQTTGIPIKIYRRVLYRDIFVGKAIAKDISIGGVGFLIPLTLGEHFVVEWPTGLRISCSEKHHFDIGNRLNFYGAAWDLEEADKVMPLLKRYSRIAYRDDTKSRAKTKAKIRRINKKLAV